MNTRYALALLVLISAFPSLSRAVAPTTMAFQGVLTDPGGKPQPPGDYTITFRLFDAPVDGNLMWTEPSKTVTISDARGLFNTALGDPTPFGLVFDQPYYLELEVAGEGVPMTPRLALAAVPYALNPASGGATLTLPFTGSITDPGLAMTIQNTSGSGIRSITSSGRAFWGTCTGASYGAYIENTGNGIGVQGSSISNVGVGGISGSWYGVAGISTTGTGVYGSISGAGGFAVSAVAGPGSSGIRTTSSSGRALWATCTGASYGAYIENTGTGIGANVLANAGIGVAGNSVTNYGVYGHSASSHGVYGVADQTGIGVYGESFLGEGVRGTSHDTAHGGIVGVNTTSGIAVYGISSGGGYAGYFDGRVRVAVLEVAGGADLAEKFETSGQAEPGTVMCIDPKNPGKLTIATSAYNRKVAGVVSGANKLSAGMVLSDPAAPASGQAVAMTGRVWVKCDTSNGAIEPGDLLTTSETGGEAMRVTDYARSQGATIGKAMTGLASGSGLVLALVSLQ